MARRTRWLLGAALLYAVAPGALPLGAQRAAAVLQPDSATVGEVVQVAVRVALPPGTEALFPDSLDLPGDMEAAGRRVVTMDSAAGGTATAVYPVIPWRPGTVELGTATVRLTGVGGGAVQVQLPPLHVLSVLPADTAGIEARPPKDVVGGNRVWWPILLALAVAALLVLLGFWLVRRHRARGAEPPVTVEPASDPREDALQALAELQRFPLEGAAQAAFFHARLTAVLRRYAAAVEPAWGAHLTTTELASRGGVRREATPLLEVLMAADLVKFARTPATPTESLARLERSRAWVEEWPPKPAETVAGTHAGEVAA